MRFAFLARHRPIWPVSCRGKPGDDGERPVIAATILDRAFQADCPSQKRRADFTCVRTAESWLEVAVVLELVSRRAVGGSGKAERQASLVMEAPMRAAWRRGNAGALLHHPDQGAHSTREAFQRRPADNGITGSMSRAGHVRDRVMGAPLVRETMARSARESVFSARKTERTARKVHRTRDDARAAAS
jgi:putative transposase